MKTRHRESRRVTGGDTAAPLLHVVFPAWTGWGMHRVFGYRFPPLHCMTLAALARRHGWQARIIDDNYEPLPDEVPDAVAISVWTALAPRAYEIAARYRARGVPVLMGGVHPSMFPAEALDHADAVVGGEAELILGEVLDDALAGRLRRHYHGPWAGMDLVPTVQELRPFYDAFPSGQYRPTHSLQTTRGCRFNCDFCSVIRINGRGSRHLDPQQVVEDFRYRASSFPSWQPNATHVFLTDDDLAADLDYAAALFEALAKAKTGVTFGVQASIGMARHPEIVRLAAEAGCRHLFIGFESVSRDALREANKKNRPSEYAEMIQRYHDARITVQGGFIFGSDSDSPDVFDHTVEVADRIGVDSAHFTVLTPFPGTKTFARMYEQGRILDLNWANYNIYRTVFEPARMSVDQLDDGVQRAYRNFYSMHRSAGRGVRAARRREYFWAAMSSAWNLSWRRGYRPSIRSPREARIAPEQVDPERLASLASTSHADASEAISVAASGLHIAGTRRSPVAGTDAVTPVASPSGRGAHEVPATS